MLARRVRIKTYNECQGTANSATSGYHETLTVFWLGVLANFASSQSADLSILEVTQRAIDRCGRAKHLAADLYTCDVVSDVRARATWLAPDIWDRCGKS